MGARLSRGIGYCLVGEFTRDVLLMFAATLPMMLIGIFIGDRIHTGLDDTTFRCLVSAALIVSGLALLVKMARPAAARQRRAQRGP